MIHSQLIDYVYNAIGPVDTDIFDKLTRTFTAEHVANCANLVSPKMKCADPSNKTRYLWGICRKNAGSKDYIKKKEIKELNFSFKI